MVHRTGSLNRRRFLGGLLCALLLPPVGFAQLRAPGRSPLAGGLNPDPASASAGQTLFRLPSITTSGILGEVPAPSDCGALEQLRPEALPVGMPVLPPVDDEPWIEFQRLIDPGKQRWSAQMTLVEGSQSSLGLDCQAIAPEMSPDPAQPRGPTELRPAVTWFQELTRGVAIQGYVGQNLRTSWRALDELKGKPACGLSVQLRSSEVASLPCVQFSFETLARPVGLDLPGTIDAGTRWDLLPGLQLLTRSNCWLAGGLMVPVGSGRAEPNGWQFNCSWRY